MKVRSAVYAGRAGGGTQTAYPCIYLQYPNTQPLPTPPLSLSQPAITPKPDTPSRIPIPDLWRVALAQGQLINSGAELA